MSDAPPPPPGRPERPPGTALPLSPHGPVIDLRMDDDDLERALVEGLDRALDRPARARAAAGEVLLREGESVEGILIVLDGRVELSRSTADGQVLLHAASAGRVIGLMALTNQTQAFFTVRAATDLTYIPLTFEELDRALRAEPSLPAHLLNVLLRSAVRRHRRAVELQLQVDHLNRRLADERDRLADALGRLEAAQTRLVEQEKMATLGQMAAGLAHELNNPVAALQRAAAFVGDDVGALLEHTTRPSGLRALLDRALRERPESTAARRARRRLLAEGVGDRRLADRLADAGVRDADEARRLLADGGEQGLATVELLHRLGTSLRNITTSVGRIAELVRSLRAYARHDAAAVEGLDVREGLDDTLRLFRHRLDRVEVARDYADVPPVSGRPGELNQVWTNLIANALDAIEDAGRLRVATDAPEAGWVRVRVTDSGPGIAPADVPRMFEPHFTTKEGRVAYGLGLGLAISRQVVERHGGRIEVASQPGRTCVAVWLPCGTQERADG